MAARRWRWFTIAILGWGGALAAPFMTACDGDSPVASVTPVDGSGAIVVTAESGAFSIGRIEVQAGTSTSIALENRDTTTHTLRIFVGESASGDVAADTGEVAAGDRGEAVVFFSAPGKRAFRCEIHPDRMHGSIVVR